MWRQTLGPRTSSTSNRTVKCISLNARSLTSLHRTNNSEGKRSNMELFQNLVYSEDSDIIFVNETWLKKDICDLEILHSGYSIFRNDRKTRGGGVLLGVKTSSLNLCMKLNTIIPWLTRFLLFQQGRLITYFPHYPCIRFCLLNFPGKFRRKQRISLSSNFPLHA